MPKSQVEGGQIRNLAVGTTQLGNLSVTTGKIANAAVTNSKIGAGAIVNTHVAAGANIAEAKLTLTRATNSLVQGNVNLLRLVTGEAIVPAGVLSVNVAFAGGFLFGGVNFRVTATRTSAIPLTLYYYAHPGFYIDTKAVGGFTLHIVVAEPHNVYFDYIAVGL